MELPEYGGLGERDFNEVVEALKTWAATHPKKGQAILILMGKTFTPDQFVAEVTEQTEFGRLFLDYIRQQSVQYRGEQVRPRTFIDRAILANERK